MNDTQQKVHSRRCFLVLGMHRSGTSALSGILNLMGANLPKALMEPHKINAKGFFESTVVRDLNDEILAATGSSWQSTSVPEQKWMLGREAKTLRKRASEVIYSEFGDAPLILIKDPRICRILPFWQCVVEALDYEIFYLHIHRNPLDVIASLRIYRMSSDLSARLWLQHQLLAEYASRHHARLFVSFYSLLAEPVQFINRVSAGFGISPTNGAEAEAIKFLSKDLLHHTTDATQCSESESLPQNVRSAFEIFERWAYQGEDSQGRDALDLLLRALLNER